MLKTLAVDGHAVDEKGLILRAQAGDADAFTRLIERRQDALYRTAWAILREEADARDGLQEACVSAWRELPRLRDAERFDAWLTRIVVNRCRTMLRSRRRHRVRQIDVDVVDEGGIASLRHTEGDALAESDAIQRAFRHLSADQRAVIVLYYVEERSIREVGAVLGVPEGTVKWRLFRARAALAKALAREDR